MSGRRFVLLSTGAALLALAILVGGVWLMLQRGSDPDIRLPDPLPSGLWPGLLVDSTPPGAPYAPLTLTTERARDILLGISRPEAYSQTVQTTLRWEGGYQVQNHRWYVRDGMYRVDTTDESGQTQVHLFTTTSLYRWTNDNLWHYYSPLPDMPPEELIGTPTLDTLLALPDESILSVEYVDNPDSPRLRFITREEYVNGEYVVSLEEGILVVARYTDDQGEQIYQSVRTVPPTSEIPPIELFCLPNGERPE